jgi:hypothetical protein
MVADTFANREQVTIMSIQQNSRFTSLENESKKIMLALLANKEALFAAIESNFRNLNLSSHQSTQRLERFCTLIRKQPQEESRAPYS